MGDHGDSPSCPISASNEVKSRMLNIDGRDCTFEEALKDENDMLRRLQFTGKRLKIAWILHSHKEDIEKIVAHHLGISLTECKAKTLETKNGSFNICVPVDVTTSSSLVPKKVYFRTPLAHKVGESDHPGNAEEKLRCEIAMYLWLEARHHRVPIVLLRGYSFGKGTAFTPLREPTPRHIYSSLDAYRKENAEITMTARLGSSESPVKWKMGYMIIDAAEGKILSSSFETEHCNERKQANLYRDLARTIVNVAQSKFSSIGSLTVDDSGFISLSNRPALSEAANFESVGGEYDLRRDETLQSAEEFVEILLQLLDARIHHADNSIRSTEDGSDDLSALVALRATRHHFRYPEKKKVFRLLLSDLHMSNIFVDEDWNITNIIDLEWAYSAPAEMFSPPYWLEPGKNFFSFMTLDSRKAYESLLFSFIQAVHDEERALSLESPDGSIAAIMRWSWDSDAMWYYKTLLTPVGFLNLYWQHILPHFGITVDEDDILKGILHKFWCVDSTSFMERKVIEFEKYKVKLKERFEEERLTQEGYMRGS